MKARTDRRLRDETSGTTQPSCPAPCDAADTPEQRPTELLSAGKTMTGTNLPSEICGPKLDRSNRLCEAMSSSCGDSEGHVSDQACPSPLGRGGCTELVHELSNLLTGVLVNAQVLEWKLPPYSHLKRPARELARTAQRSSELLKRLAFHLTGSCDGCTSGIFPKRDDVS